MADEHYMPEGSGSESSTFEVSDEESDVSSQTNSQVNEAGVKNKKKKIKRKKAKFTPEENAEVILWLETKYRELYGRGGSSSVSADKDEIWEEFAKDVNAIHNGQYQRSPKDIFKRIDNMKKNGTCIKSNKQLFKFFKFQVFQLQLTLLIHSVPIVKTTIKTRKNDWSGVLNVYRVL